MERRYRIVNEKLSRFKIPFAVIFISIGFLFIFTTSLPKTSMIYISIVFLTLPLPVLLFATFDYIFYIDYLEIQDGTIMCREFRYKISDLGLHTGTLPIILDISSVRDDFAIITILEKDITHRVKILKPLTTMTHEFESELLLLFER